MLSFNSAHVLIKYFKILNLAQTKIHYLIFGPITHFSVAQNQSVYMFENESQSYIEDTYTLSAVDSSTNSK